MPDDNKTQFPDYDPENPRCNEEQLEFLKDCIAKGPEGIAEWNRWRIDNRGTEIWLQRADLREDHLEGAYLWQAHLEGAGLSKAHLEGAYLREAHLEGAILIEANVRKVDFSGVFLQGTNCRKAIVDGATLIWDCKINKRGIKEKNYTDFAGVGLNSARIQPQIKQLLEYNIRKSNWSRWYNRLWDRNLFTKIISSPLVAIKWGLVRPFWFIPDYGRTMVRILIILLLLALAYATIYFYHPDCVYINGCNIPFSSYLHAVYFSVVTMTTLGFGDIAANPDSTAGLVLLMSQVFMGYILLGALVTRFAVLFTAGGPAGKFEPIHSKIQRLIKKIKKIKGEKSTQLWCELGKEISEGKYKHD